MHDANLQDGNLTEGSEAGGAGEDTAPEIAGDSDVAV